MYKAKLFALALLLFVASASAASTVQNKIYFLNMEYDKGAIKLIEVSVISGYAPDRRIQPEDGYRLEVVSFRGASLHSFRFEVPLIMFRAPPRPGEEALPPLILEKTNFTLAVPYFENGREINIYGQNNTKMLSIDVSRFALAECVADGECADGDPCTQDSCAGTPRKCSNAPIPGCAAPAAEFPTALVAGAAVAVVAGLLAFLFIRRRKSQGTR